MELRQALEGAGWTCASMTPDPNAAPPTDPWIASLRLSRRERLRDGKEAYFFNVVTIDTFTPNS